MKKQAVIFCVMLLCFPSKAFCFDFFDNLSRVGELSTEIDAIKVENAELKREITDIKNKLASYELFIDYTNKALWRFSTLSPTNIRIDPTMNQYSILTCYNGYFAVFCENIKSYGTGSELTLGLVNLLGTTVTDIELKFTYSNSPVFDENNPNNSWKNYEAGKKEKIEKPQPDFPPGTKRSIKIRLPEYKPDQLKHISLEASVGGIRFR